MRIPSRVLSKLYEEIERAESLHPNWPENPFIQLAIIQEEVGEVTKALLDLNHSAAAQATNVQNPTQMGFVEQSKAVAEAELNKKEMHLENELIQTAAMCIRMLSWMNDEETGNQNTSQA